MARIDFTNARIEVGIDTPLATSYVGLATNFDSGPDTGYTVSTPTRTVITPNKNRLIIRYVGTIAAGRSGTFFYLYSGAYFWKISNISFSGGDTYDFTIGCDLTCN